MSKFLPPKPLFRPGTLLTSDAISDYRTSGCWIQEPDFHQYYDREIRPLFENAVEVYQSTMSEADWSIHPTYWAESDKQKIPFNLTKHFSSI